VLPSVTLNFELALNRRLVVMVVFLFLRTLSATVYQHAVPLSLVGTFGVMMYLLGYSLNNLSLMALTISTGFVVDDAIVMIENIAAYIEQGDRRCSRLAWFRANCFHDHLSHHFADCSSHPASVHGRYRRPALPRIRYHAGGHDPDLSRWSPDSNFAMSPQKRCLGRHQTSAARAGVSMVGERLRALHAFYGDFENLVASGRHG